MQPGMGPSQYLLHNVDRLALFFFRWSIRKMKSNHSSGGRWISGSYSSDLGIKGSAMDICVDGMYQAKILWSINNYKGMRY